MPFLSYLLCIQTICAGYTSVWLLSDDGCLYLIKYFAAYSNIFYHLLFNHLIKVSYNSYLESDKDQQGQHSTPSSCIEDLSTLLRSIMLSITGNHMIQELKVLELLSVWADMIAEWHAWEESEDLSIFDCIKEVVNLDQRYGLKNFIVKQMPSPPAPPVPERSIIESICAFISEAILQYPSATWRACSCVHILLHCPTYSLETEGVKQALAVAFCRAAFSRFGEVQSKPCPLWKPLLLAISSCFLCYPDTVEGILEKGEKVGIAVWASALCHVSSSTFEAGLTTESDIKLIGKLFTFSPYYFILFLNI